MPIPFYNLHDRTAEQLAAEMVRLIPAHTPEWRNPRPGDPGRTLIDLFAWMGDKLLYRVNLLPERQRLMFLKLLDMPLRPAMPATGLLQLRHAAPRDGARAEVPGRTLVPGPVEFETLDDATILPVEGAVFVKRRPNGVEAGSIDNIQASLNSVYDLEASAPYVTTHLFADGRADPAGIDIARETVDQCLWIALLAGEAPADKQAFRQAAFGRAGAGPVLVNLGLAPRTTISLEEASIDAPVVRPENWVWQVPSPRAGASGTPHYNTLPPAVTDTTDGFTRPGIVRLVLPDAGEIGLPENDPDIDVMAGVGDRPPRLDDPERSARLVGWLRLKPRHRAETLALSWAGLNTVAIEQRRSLRNIVLGATTGGGDQQIPLPARSVDSDSLVIEVQRGDGVYEPWSGTGELAAHGGDDKVYRLDPEAGVISFGDGLRGAAPPRGAKVRAALLRHGGGRAGNLPAATLEAISHARLAASQPVATQGGEEAETLDAAEQRLPGRLRHGDRAVTERDFRDLALQTPSVDLARAEVMPRFRPYQRLSDVPGAVSVLIVPTPARLDAPHPRPDRTILAAVQSYLDARRLMGTELHVIGPEYRPISVSAALRVRDGHAPDRVLGDVETALRTYLAPVAPGGREATGWPLGQTIANLELEVVVARVTGVEAVYGLNLFRRDQAGTGWTLIAPLATGQQNVTLDAWMLPELAEVSLSQDPGGPASGIIDPTAGQGDGGLITPIPVVPELC